MPEWRKDAYHNTEGFYTVPDPEKFSGDFLEDPFTKILIPKPKGKPIRFMDFSLPGGNYRLEVDESIEAIQSAVRHARSDESQEWYEFTDPVFGTAVLVGLNALRHGLYAILDGFKDMEAVKQQMEMAEIAKTMQERQLTQAKTQSLGLKRK